MSDEEIIQELALWIRELGVNAPPGDDIIAFNFGLFQSADDGYCIYISGSRIFDPNNDDWACEKDYWPQGRYFKHLFDQESSWESMLHHAVRLTTRYLHSAHYKTSILRNAHAITVGFDDGDLTRIL